MGAEQELAAAIAAARSYARHQRLAAKVAYWLSFAALVLLAWSIFGLLRCF